MSAGIPHVLVKSMPMCSAMPALPPLAKIKTLFVLDLLDILNFSSINFALFTSSDCFTIVCVTVLATISENILHLTIVGISKFGRTI